MRFAKFNKGARAIWINPDRVHTVSVADGGDAHIDFGNGEWMTVDCAPEEAVRRLRGERQRGS